MKKIFTAACLLMFAAQGFSQNNATNIMANNTQPALVETLATTVLVYNTPEVTPLQTEECKLAYAATVRSLTATPVTGYNAANAGGAGIQKAMQPLVSIQGIGNLYSFKRQWPVYASFFGAGLAYGTAEALIWHPASTSKFWNPYNSWKTGGAVDGYHAARAVGIACFMAGAVLSVNDIKHPFSWKMLKKVAICSAAYWAGQMITWHAVK